MLCGVSIAVAVSAIWIVAHVAWMHVRPADNRFRAMLVSYVASLPLVLIGCWWLPGQGWGFLGGGGEHPAFPYIHAFLLHLLIYFCFVECFYHVERAVTLRFLIEILEAPGGATKIEAITKDYNVEEMIERRLEVLERNRFVVREADGWRLAPKGLFFARAYGISSALFRSKGQSERM